MWGDVLYIIMYEDLLGPGSLVRCIKMCDGENRLRLLAQNHSLFTFKYKSGPIANTTALFVLAVRVSRIEHSSQVLKSEIISQSELRCYIHSLHTHRTTHLPTKAIQLFLVRQVSGIWFPYVSSQISPAAIVFL